MDTADLTRLSFTVDLLVAAPHKHAEILERLRQEASEQVVERVRLLDVIDALSEAFGREQWESLVSEADRLGRLEMIAHTFGESSDPAKRLAAGVLEWALSIRRSTRRRRRTSRLGASN